jgi:alkylhydroperoxidase/carboxymuconolactone decarboxylase family protein YurZ
MTESQLELNQELDELFNMYCQLMPEVGESYKSLQDEVYRADALSAKVKRLIAVSGALVHG